MDPNTEMYLSRHLNTLKVGLRAMIVLYIVSIIIYTVLTFVFSPNEDVFLIFNVCGAIVGILIHLFGYFVSYRLNLSLSYVALGLSTLLTVYNFAYWALFTNKIGYRIGFACILVQSSGIAFDTFAYIRKFRKFVQQYKDDPNGVNNNVNV